ncbi:MAG: hypothetical protein WBC04_20330 [Candidatus Acidiferrales bacterium]
MIQPRFAGWRSKGSDRAFADTPLAAGLAAAACVMAGFLAAHLAPFVASGANLSDPAQADYAQNLWSSTIPALVALASICPLAAFGLLPPLMRGPRRILLVVSVAALCVAGFFAVNGVNGYRQPPVTIIGAVASFQGRDILLRGFQTQTHHLIVSDQELRQAHSWVRPQTVVFLYVNPSGDAGYIGPSATSGLGQ